MPDDITLKIGADASDVENSIDQVARSVRSKFQMAATGTPGSPLLTPLPFGLGGPPPVPGPLTQAAMRQVERGPIKQATEDMDMFGKSMDRAMNMLGRMVERMLIFGTVIEAMHRAFELFHNSITEVIEDQALTTRFEILSTEGENFTQVLDQMNAAALATGSSLKDLYAASLRLQEGGATAKEAANQVGRIAEMAKLAGESATTMQEQLHRLELRQATISDMRTLSDLTGQAKQHIHELIREYEQLQATIPRVNLQMEILDRTESRAMTAMEVALSRSEQLWDHEYQLVQRQIEAENELRSAHESFAQKAGIDFSKQLQATGGSFLSVNQAAAQANPAVPWSTRLALANQQAKELQLGMRQIGQEEKMSAAEVANSIRAGVIGQQDLLQAAQRAHEQQHRQMQYQEEDRHWQMQQVRNAMEDQRRQAQYAIEDRHLNQQIELEGKRMDIQNKIAAGLADDATLHKEIAKQSGTIADAWEKTQNAIGLAFQKGQVLNAIMFTLSGGQYGALPGAKFDLSRTGPISPTMMGAGGFGYLQQGKDPQMDRNNALLEQMNNHWLTLIGGGG